MAISLSDCAPYLSATLFRLDRADPQLTTKVRAAIVSLLEKSPSRLGRTIQKPLPRKSGNDLDITWFSYKEEAPPAWYAKNDLTDVSHHIVLLCRKGRLLAITFSDTATRNAVLQKIEAAKEPPFSRLSLLLPQEINAAFVEEPVRTLWLSGTHNRSLVKPDAKVLSGLDLGSALDPLADQSFYFSSVRSASTNAELENNGRAAVIGASPRHARVWLGPTRNWNEFTLRIELILDQAQKKTAGSLPESPAIPVLAQPSRGLSGVKQPYDLAIIVPEMIVAGNETDDGDERWHQQFADAARFKIHPQSGSPNFDAEIFWGNERLGKLRYTFEERARRRVRLKIEKNAWDSSIDTDEDLLRICKNPDNLTIYFDTGHTFSRGQFYSTQFRDAVFENWRWINMSVPQINVQQEKPLDGRRFAVESIGNANDQSLFGFVARHWPDLAGLGAPTGWLICDDGAMESADFIHFAPDSSPPHLTLIHVKGSHSDNQDRGLSVSDYEVVVGQAVKNLRHVDRENIAEKLKANKNGQLRDAVWFNGVRQQNRDDVLRVLSDAGSNMKKTVVVLQPRVRKSVYDDIRASRPRRGQQLAKIRRMQQLDALLLGARADCFGLGADFYVIGEDDTPV